MSEKQKVNILMVDDQPAKLLSYEAMLAELGENLIRATSASEALESLLEKNIAVVLSDVNMPDLNGFALVDAIRAHPRFEKLAVIFVSAVHLSMADRLRGYQHGAVDYVTVPVVPEILRAKVRVFVDLYRKSKALENLNAGLEERVGERTAALAASEERFRLATEAMSGGLYDWNLETDSWWRSSGLFALVGVEDEIELSKSWWLARIHPDDSDRRWNEIRNAFDTGEAAFDVQYRVRHSQEKWTWVWDRGRIVRNAAGRVLRVVGHVTDISGQKKAEEALQLAHRRKDEFLAMLSHELRNPLAPIRNAVEILRMSPLSGEGPLNGLDLIERHVNQLRRLVDDLLDITRISNDSLTLRQEVMDLGDAVKLAVEANSPLLTERNHRLNVVPPTNIFVNGDVVRLTQVFTNLLNNGAKYTPPGGEISLVTESGDDGWVRVIVKDNGKGIDAVDLSRLFTMFYRASDTSQYASDGLGVGLALVAKVIDMHGGKIEATSEGPNKGSEFRVCLPVVSQLKTSPANPEVRRDQTMPCSSIRRILVADDSVDNAATLSMLLEVKGFDVRTARDGLEALIVGSQFLPDAVLLDIGMPVLDGYSTARRIRGESWGTDVLLVAQSGWTQQEDRDRSREAGFDAHLGKPLDLEKLMALLNSKRAETV
jgi:PAS domain S-box-containing protein